MNPNRYINHSLFQLVEQEVSDLEQEFKEHKGLILTEGDLQGHLFARLKRRLPEYIDTMDHNTTGLAVHSEVSYYNATGKLVHKPDICIIPPRELSIYRPIELEGAGQRNRLPSKGFQFAGDSLAMEVKFCRNKTGMSDKNIQHYQKDFDKLKTLHDLREQRTHGIVYLLGMVIVFNKTDLGREKFLQFKNRNQHSNIRIVYCTGNVIFDEQN